MSLPWDNNSWDVAAQIAVRHHRELAAQQHRAAAVTVRAHFRYGRQRRKRNCCCKR